MCTLYENIKTLCEKKGVTGAKMCNDIGISKSLMTSLKSGRTSTINSKTAQKIADYFSVPVDRLFAAAPEISYDQLTFNCCDLQLFSEQKKKPIHEDELSEKQKKFMQFCESVPDDKVDRMIRIMQSILENDL